MHAATYHGPGRPRWEEVPDPDVVLPTDAVVRVDTVTICGTDLHILGGDVPEVREGTVLGHEAVGTVEQVGGAVSAVSPGDRVLVSCISACGRCHYCRRSRYGQCLEGGGWVLGHTVHGTQAERVRVPFADTSLHHAPPGVDDDALVMLADILPTGFEVGVLNGRVEPGSTVVVVGAGPIGLATVLGARLFSPEHVVVVDPATTRREAATSFGADVVVDPTREDPLEVVGALTGGLGADVAVEAVGLPETFELCTRLVRPGGRVANVGVHGRPAVLHLEDLWIRDVTLTTGLVDTSSTPDLLRLLASGQLDASRFVTHRFALEQVEEAYDVFRRAGETGALKVLLTRA